MTRTNIDLDDELVERAMRKFGLSTKRSAVELALQRLVGPPVTGDALLRYLQDVEGTGWDADDGILNDEIP